MTLVLQSDRSECAVACLAMVAGFHGHRATLREFRARFRTSERGTTLAGLRDYAEQLGFKCRGVRAELDELGQLRVPAILHWNLDHFVVLQKVGRRRVTVLDPAVGMRRLRMTDVDGCFTGVALELVPTLGLVRRKPGATVGLWDFVPVLRGLGGALATVCLLTVALQAFALAMPLNMQLAVDHGVRQGDFGVVGALAVGFGLVGLVSAATEWAAEPACAVRRQHVGVPHGQWSRPPPAEASGRVASWWTGGRRRRFAGKVVSRDPAHPAPPSRPVPGRSPSA